jgi:CheY-like chemotaxis protein/anti-sigma regulatory factor (Ser/Thr protein kinase)
MAKVLVVDDSPVELRLVGSLLEKRPDLVVSSAANGREALAAVERDPPDLVLTDLQMPEMNGLELVEEVRDRYPLVPVILMTAHGSEDIAVQALKRGAASYVPKKDLARDLLETLDTVLNAATAQRGQERLLECLMRTESQFLLDNDPALIAPLVGHLRENLVRMQLCDETGLIRVIVALSEALTNAIYHGNLEIDPKLREKDPAAWQRLVEERRQQKPYRDRRVHVLAQELLQKAKYVIRDEGPGFDPSSVPDPSDPASLEKDTGRGLLLIRTFMDEVYHNERGNEITFVKKRDW